MHVKRLHWLPRNGVKKTHHFTVIIIIGAYDIDYLGTKKIIDACVDEGVGKYVLVSSILANGISAGQGLNPQYLLLNAFGGVLFWKQKAEVYLQKQVGVSDMYFIPKKNCKRINSIL